MKLGMPASCFRATLTSCLSLSSRKNDNSTTICMRFACNKPCRTGGASDAREQSQGTSPMWRCSSVINAWQKRMTSPLLLPCMYQSTAPLLYTVHLQARGCRAHIPRQACSCVRQTGDRLLLALAMRCTWQALRCGRRCTLLPVRKQVTLGSKSQPPLPPPIGSVVSEFLKICSKPRNLMMLSVTLGWKRSPPAHMQETRCQHFVTAQLLTHRHECETL